MTEKNKRKIKVDCVRCQKNKILLTDIDFICKKCGFDNINFIDAIWDPKLRYSFLGFMKIYDENDFLINKERFE